MEATTSILRMRTVLLTHPSMCLLVDTLKVVRSQIMMVFAANTILWLEQTGPLLKAIEVVSHNIATKVNKQIGE